MRLDCLGTAHDYSVTHIADKVNRFGGFYTSRVMFDRNGAGEYV